MRYLKGSAVLFFCLVLLAGCSARAVLLPQPPGSESVTKASAVSASFIGVPIVGDYDQSEDLDFVLRADSAGWVYKVRVHEKAGPDNRRLLSQLCSWINEIEDLEPVKVSGKYRPQYRAEGTEYGSMELNEIAFLDTVPGFAPPYETNQSNAFRHSVYFILLFLPVLAFTTN